MLRVNWKSIGCIIHIAENYSASEEISSTDTESAADGSENAEESAEKDTAESKEEDNG